MREYILLESRWAVERVESLQLSRIHNTILGANLERPKAIAKCGNVVCSKRRKEGIAVIDGT